MAEAIIIPKDRIQSTIKCGGVYLCTTTAESTKKNMRCIVVSGDSFIASENEMIYAVFADYDPCQGYTVYPDTIESMMKEDLATLDFVGSIDHTDLIEIYKEIDKYFESIKSQFDR